MTHDDSQWGYDPNCMCDRCHSIWESLVRNGDNVTINKWIDDTNEANK